MTEYITKQQVAEWFESYGMIDDRIPYDVLVTDLRVMEAADVAPVRHGKWEYHKGSNYTISHYRCSFCGRPQWSFDVYNEFRYCPVCGAKMDLEG